MTGRHTDSHGDAEALFRELAELLNLPYDHAQRLAPGVPFTASGDMICRFQLIVDEDTLLIRPELVLPLDENDIRAIDAAQLLAVQQVLQAEVQWTLGYSPEGLLQTSPVAWSREASAAAAQLDLGVSLADMMLDLLLPDARHPKHGHTTQ